MSISRVKIVSLIVIMVLVSACSPKKNTRATRFYHGLTTRFNVYFNGNESYKESLKNMQRDFQDDFTALVHMHPVSAYSNEKEQKPSGDFKRPIDKGKKAIQLHSIKKKPKMDPKKRSDPKYRAFINREEFNPYIHNAWFLIAKSQFYQGEFLEAASTFNYITKHFTWLEDLVKESKIWLMRCYTELGWLYEAEDVMHKISLDSIPSKLQGELAMVTAQLHISKEEYEEAIPLLKKSIASQKDKNQKIRQTFLLAQLYQKCGENKLSYDTYSKVISMNPIYRTQFNARIKQTEVMTMQDTSKVIKGLNKMAKASRNKEYLDQIYYAIGNIHLTAGDTLKAIDYYEKANAESTRNGIEKAINQITLGNIYFAQRRYTKAQPCYAEGVPLVSEDYPNYPVLLKRSEVLDDLVIHSSTVETQDSLRYVASLPEEEIMKLIEAKIEEIKEQERLLAEEQERQEYLAQQTATNAAFGESLAGGGAQAPTGPGMQIGGRSTSWYFYNKATIATGKTDFQRRWGKRKLEDNWRRINKAAFSMSDFEEYDYEAEEEAEALADSLAQAQALADSLNAPVTDTKDPRYYLQQLPRTPEEIALSDELIMDGLFNMGVVLKDDLEDYEAAMEVFSRLMTEYPDNAYMLDTYYNIYLMNMISDDKIEAESYRQKILTEFSDSKYAKAMADPNYLENIRRMDIEQDSLYRFVYEVFVEGLNGEVHSRYDEFVNMYPLSELMPKFMLVNALAYVNEGDIENFKIALRELLERYPEEDVSTLATAMLKGVAEGRQVVSGTGKHDIFNVRLGGGALTDSIEGEAELPPFVWDKEAPHEMLLVFSADTIDANQILFVAARYNFTNFYIKDFDLSITTTDGVGMLRISGFDNLRELILYRRKIEAPDGMELPEGVRIVMISSENYNILMQGNTFENYFKFWESSMAADAEIE